MSKRIQSKTSQSKNTQSKNTQSKNSQSKNSQSKKHQSKNTRCEKVKTQIVAIDKELVYIEFVDIINKLKLPCYYPFFKIPHDIFELMRCASLIHGGGPSKIGMSICEQSCIEFQKRLDPNLCILPHNIDVKNHYIVESFICYSDLCFRNDGNEYEVYVDINKLMSLKNINEVCVQTIGGKVAGRLRDICNNETYEIFVDNLHDPRVVDFFAIKNINFCDPNVGYHYNIQVEDTCMREMSISQFKRFLDTIQLVNKMSITDFKEFIATLRLELPYYCHRND
jgi:hypothetical protein